MRIWTQHKVKKLSVYQQSPTPPPPSPVGRLNVIPPIQSPDENPGERREEEEEIPYPPSYCPVCTPFHIPAKSPEQVQYILLEFYYEGKYDTEED